MTTALIETRTGRTVSYAELRKLTEQFSALLCAAKQLVLIRTINCIGIIAAMQGARESGHALLLCDEHSSDAYLSKVIALYQPEILVLPAPDLTDKNYKLHASLENLFIFKRRAEATTNIHPDLEFLLTTSGSTGSPKLAKLSHKNIATNTKDIIEALNIQPEDRVAAHMPLAYSYGLTVINTHLAAGASVILFDESMTSNAFWKSIREYKVTSLPGIPYHFTLIHRLGLDRLNIPDVCIMTQAGGRMQPEFVLHFAKAMQHRGGQFFVMYGQTEASPRMTILPAEHALDKAGSVGLPLRHGKIVIEDGEIIYTGDNVMMGYAENRADLQLGDSMFGRLATGDLGYLDQDGYLFLTGRKSRFAKIDGLRVSLDEVEIFANKIAPTVAIEKNEQLVLFTIGDADNVRAHVLEKICIHAGRIHCSTITTLPRLTNGKIDILALQELAP